MAGSMISRGFSSFTVTLVDKNYGKKGQGIRSWRRREDDMKRQT